MPADVLGRPEVSAEEAPSGRRVKENSPDYGRALFFVADRRDPLFYGAGNLFIADGSVFVTGAGANPSLTIMALAARTADGMIAAFKRGEM